MRDFLEVEDFYTEGPKIKVSSLQKGDLLDICTSNLYFSPYGHDNDDHRRVPSCLFVETVQEESGRNMMVVQILGANGIEQRRFGAEEITYIGLIARGKAADFLFRTINHLLPKEKQLKEKLVITLKTGGFLN